LAPQKSAKHKWQSTDPGTALAFNPIQYSARIKTLKQDERYTQPDTRQHRETSTGMHHRARYRSDLSSIQVPPERLRGFA
jgi:hypothetical protein